jgi:hypothetical protein
MSGIATTATAPTKKPDYIDELLIDACYEMIRREGYYKSLDNAAWDAAAVEMAERLRSHVDSSLALIAKRIEDPPCEDQRSLL